MGDVLFLHNYRPHGKRRRALTLQAEALRRDIDAFENYLASTSDPDTDTVFALVSLTFAYQEVCLELDRLNRLAQMLS